MSFVHIRNFTFHLFDRQTNGYGQVAMLCIPIRARKEKTGIWVPRRVPAQVISQKRNISQLKSPPKIAPCFMGHLPACFAMVSNTCFLVWSVSFLVLEEAR